MAKLIPTSPSDSYEGIILNGAKTVLLFGSASQDVSQSQVQVPVAVFDPTIKE
jgi:hypothetical protein